MRQRACRRLVTLLFAAGVGRPGRRRPVRLRDGRPGTRRENGGRPCQRLTVAPDRPGHHPSLWAGSSPPPPPLAALEAAGVQPRTLLARHAQSDWGDIVEEDRQLNALALINGERLLSAYTLPNNVRVWVITEADRSATTLILPEEY